MPPNPQFWGNKNFQVPHFTPKLGGYGGRGFRRLNISKSPKLGGFRGLNYMQLYKEMVLEIGINE